MSRLLAPLLAFSASLLLLLVFTPVFLPNPAMLKQYDFWGVLLLLQLLLATPILLLELALAKRSQSSSIQGIMQLTREADVSPRWRALAWAGAVLLAILASVLLLNVSQLSQRELQVQAAIQLQPLWIYATLAVLSLGLSILPRVILVLVSAVMALATVLSAQLLAPVEISSVWKITAFTGADWGTAVGLVAINSVLGTGVYWQLRNHVLAASQPSELTLSNHGFLSRILMVQVLAIVLAALSLGNLHQFVASAVATFSLIVAGLFLAALFWQLLLQQLQQRQASLLLRAAIVLLPIILFSQLSFAFATEIALLMALILTAGYAIFAGWRMKISHLRKALNFSHEGVYNVWRVLLRIVLPLIFMSGLVSLVMAWR